MHVEIIIEKRIFLVFVLRLTKTECTIYHKRGIISIMHVNFPLFPMYAVDHGVAELARVPPPPPQKKRIKKNKRK